MTTIREKLTSIREKYRSILEITAELGSAPERETLDTALVRRAGILDAITDERYNLDSCCGGWLDKARENTVLAGIVNEIVETIRSIADMDSALAEKVAQTIHATRNEMQAVYHSSRAARAYSAHILPS